jgi:ATP-dependent DNA helicase RecQ
MDSLAHNDRAGRMLREIFGLGDFRSGQEPVIQGLLAGRSMLAVFPTGGGKSLCYQLPALLLDGLTLVVSPLIALMKDQVDTLQARGIAAARLDSTLGEKEAAEVIDGVISGKLKLLYVAPERLANPRFLETMRRTPVAMMAIDEAHCIAEWGHNFRPDYLKLAPLAKRIRAGRVLCLTATATPPVAAEIREAFAIRKADHVQTGFRRPNLVYFVTPCTAAERRERLLERIREVEGAAIVYVTLQQTAETVAGWLSRNGIDAKAYHAGLNDEYRAGVQERFAAGEIRVVVATIAFGMGIDKADIRAVYHYNLPKSLENYMQETGRAGRDGFPAHCEIFACADDLVVLENFIYGDTPSVQAVKNLVDHVLRLGDTFSVSKYTLSTTLDIRPMVVETLLAHLETRGFIEPTDLFYAGFRVRFLRPEEDVLCEGDAASRKQLQAILATGERRRGCVDLVPESAAVETGIPEAKIRRAIADLELAGDATVRPSGLRHGYRVKRRPERVEDVAADFCELFARREERDIARLHDVVAFAEGGRCLVRRLMEYFGEKKIAACGVCSVCLGSGRAKRLPRTSPPEIGLEDLEAIQAVVAERRPALRTPRQLARFLCGLASPATTRARLQRHDAFGLLDRHPFERVLAQADSLHGW